MHDISNANARHIRRFLHDYVYGHCYVDSTALNLSAWNVPDEPVPFNEAVAQDYSPISVGDAWGTPWSTMWLHLTGEISPGWSDFDASRYSPELILDFDFTNQPGFQAEGLVWKPDGTIVKAINPFNQSVPLGDVKAVDLYVECAANPNVGEFDFFPKTLMGDKATAPKVPIYHVKRAEVGLFDVHMWELEQDFRVLWELMEELPESHPRKHQILTVLEKAVDAANLDDMASSVGPMREILREALEVPADASALTMVATGHAHIDSAWLWPTRETVRKCARTFSNVCDLMDRYPEFTFSCSSAQQFFWIEKNYPGLFARIKQKVAEGRFIPVGGMWVESDSNMPGPEAMVRQFVEGKNYFLNAFGIETKETWLPDTFGYSGALPQIAKLAGNKYFLTQKVSWNQFNVFPHHTFIWEGIDGSTQFTHFPPADTYASEFTAKELRHFNDNFKEKGRASLGLALFGYGDGGGGPVREHLARAKRLANLAGSTKVELSTPMDFFQRAEKEYASPPTWTGELYLEFHRGTYSSQIKTKQGNRRCEHLLHEAELWSTQAWLEKGLEYPYQELQDLWRIVLLNQFHDILPGSSITWVAKDAESDYEKVASACEDIIRKALTALVGEGNQLIGLNASAIASKHGIEAISGRAFDSGHPDQAQGATLTSISEGDANPLCLLLENSWLRAKVDQNGNVISLVDLQSNRESIPAGEPAALLQIHRDDPSVWDSWEIEDHYLRNRTDLTAPTALESREEDGEARVIATYKTPTSTIVKTIALGPDDRSLQIRLGLDWHEEKKLLKMAFPLDLRADFMSSEIQFGHVNRPIPVNTLWDFARFETPAQRWVRVAEGNFGVAIANDSSYGYDVQRWVRSDGYTTTCPRVTIIRSAVYPDPRAEAGQYQIGLSLRPNASITDAAAEGYGMNLPDRFVTGGEVPRPLLQVVDSDAILVETIKLADDRSGDMVARLYESTGSSEDASVAVPDWCSEVYATDLLERPISDALEITQGRIHLRMHPFEIKTLRFKK